MLGVVLFAKVVRIYSEISLENNLKRKGHCFWCDNREWRAVASD